MSFMRTALGLVTALVVISVVVAGCGGSAEKLPVSQERTAPAEEPAAAAQQPATGATRLDTYTLRGLTFSYYLIPAGLDDDGVLETARRIHQGEPEAQLLLVDDDSMVKEYIAWAKASSVGDGSVEMPTEWADEHIVANLQKMLGGGWMLCRGNGYEEMGRLD